MIKPFLSVSLIASTIFMSLNAENNHTLDMNITVKQSSSVEQKNDKNNTISKSELAKQQVHEQMEREKKYAKEMKFYQGDEYDLKAVEVNQKSLDSIPIIEPDYDFDITDVYRDDL